MRNSKIKAALCALLFSFFGFATVESECGDMTEKQDQQCVEVRAAHILMETESQANEILQEINDGKISFEDAAKNHRNVLLVQKVPIWDISDAEQW